MTKPTPVSDAPFGAEARRARLPLILMCILYGGWLLVLLWLATYHVGLK